MSWTREDQLLLEMCRSVSQRTSARVNLVPREKRIDWSLFLEKARENGVAAIVYHVVNEEKVYILNMPPAILAELQRDYYSNATRNTLLFEELGKVLRAFNQTGLSAIVLKGAALAETAYSNMALRPMSDIDLLVRIEDLCAVDQQLKTVGYHASDRDIHALDFSSSYLTTLDYRNLTEDSASFHLHWHFVNSTIPNEFYAKKITMPHIWEDAEKACFDGTESLVMSPHHLLIHLSEHALRVTHSLSKLSFFCDIHMAISFYQKTLDWDKLLQESADFNLDRMVWLSLSFTSRFLGTRIPEYVLRKLKPRRLTLGERIFIHFISNNKRFPGMSYFVHLAMNRGLYHKMCFVWRTLYPPRQILAQRSYILPSDVNFRHYLRRTHEVFSHFFKILR